MAPEQTDGREVTARSDIYSLGLVLHEVVTGKRPGSSGTTKDIDPAMEKAIQRCLDPDPARRPATALDVARALPGGDPLAEALAAGETPSPELVAASEDTGALSVRAAVGCFAFVIVALVAIVLLKNEVSLLRVIPTPHSPEVLAQKARDLAVRFGYVEAPQDEAFFFSNDGLYEEYAVQHWTPQQYRTRLASGWPRSIGFVYRRSSRYLDPNDATGIVQTDDPAPTVSGMIRVELDTRGRLYYFDAVPPQVEEPGSGAFDWSELFSAAGLDQSQFLPTPPQWIPLVSFDARAAWTGTLEGEPPIAIRLEAASWKGRPVYFQMVRPWTRPAREQSAPVSTAQRISQWFIIGLFSLLLLVAVFLARRHYRSQRGDVRGSVRLASLAGVGALIDWFVTAHHIPTNAEFFNLADSISVGAYRALLIGVLYMALEPYVRRRWPQSLIAWTRLLGGGMRDPLVGGHVLVGTALGLGAHVVVLTIRQWRDGLVVTPNPLSLQGWGFGLGALLNILGSAVIISLFFFFLFFLVRVALRRDWLAGAAVVALLTLAITAPNQAVWGMTGTILTGLGLGTAVWVLLRFGVLSLTTGLFVLVLMINFPMTSDLSAWYSRASLVVLATLLALSVWSFRAALGGRRVWKDDFLDA